MALILAQLTECFDKQLSILRKTTYDDFNSKLRGIRGKDFANDRFHQQTSKIQKESQTKYE